MLIHSKQYVEGHGSNSFNLGLYGQDNNGSIWSMCKMNMILHGIATGIVAGRYQFLTGNWHYFKELIRTLEWGSA